MDKVTNVTISSRRSVKIGYEFLTFEMGLEADVNNMTEAEKKEYIKKMWKYAADEVDNQIKDAASIQS